MADEFVEAELTHEDRLKALVYQFIGLYDRLSEDRLVAAKQGADIAQLVNVFTEQLKQFKTLESNVRQQMKTSIESAVSEAGKKLGEDIGKEATRAVENSAGNLKNNVDQANDTLNHYKKEILIYKWETIIISASLTLLACFLRFG